MEQVWPRRVAQMCGPDAHLLELDSSSVSLLQDRAGLGAAFGRHSITTRPFFAARTLFTGLCSNVGAQAEEKHFPLFMRVIANNALAAGHAEIYGTFLYS